MKQKVTLWARIDKGGRILYTAAQKEWLNNFEPEHDAGIYYDVELTGEYVENDITA